MEASTSAVARATSSAASWSALACSCALSEAAVVRGLVEDALTLVAGVGDAVLHVGQLGLGLGLGRGGVVELLGQALGAAAQAALDRRAGRT